jgi:hypothetical protein
MLVVFALPVAAYDKEDDQIVIYEEFHIPIKFAETVELNTLKPGDKIDIAVNEDTGLDEDNKVFKENAKGYAVVEKKDGKWHIENGKIIDIYGYQHPIIIKGFYLKYFDKGGKYIIKEGYVIDAFTKEKKIYHRQ